jgi:alpha-L-fucosidase
MMDSVYGQPEINIVLNTTPRVIGSRRDIVRDLAEAIRNVGLKFGLYYSFLEWESTKTNWQHDERFAHERTGYYIPKPLYDKYRIPEDEFILYLYAQGKELVQNYEPALLFFDGAWDYPDSY